MSAADVQLAAERILNGASHRHLVLLCDFDGTLSEFDNDPAAVWLKPGRRDLLERLATSPGVTLAIVSGRRLEDVKARTALSSAAYYAGLHGLEIQSAQERYLHPGTRRGGDRAARTGGSARRGSGGDRRCVSRGQDARARRALPGIQRRRCTPRRGSPHAAREADLDAGTLRVMRGASMVELMPNIEWHKGSAVEWILDRVRRQHGTPWPVYIGDDLTDEDGFRAVQDIGLSIAASERAAGADLAVDGPSEVEALLRAIAPRTRELTRDPSGGEDDRHRLRDELPVVGVGHQPLQTFPAPLAVRQRQVVHVHPDELVRLLRSSPRPNCSAYSTASSRCERA